MSNSSNVVSIRDKAPLLINSIHANTQSLSMPPVNGLANLTANLAPSSRIKLQTDFAASLDTNAHQNHTQYIRKVGTMSGSASSTGSHTTPCLDGILACVYHSRSLPNNATVPNPSRLSIASTGAPGTTQAPHSYDAVVNSKMNVTESKWSQKKSFANVFSALRESRDHS